MIPKSHIRLGKPDGLTSDDIYADIKVTTTDAIKCKCDANASLPVINVKSLVPYLPYLDIKTESEGHGLVNDDYVIYKEKDGTLVGLRPGSNGEVTKYFYFYSRDVNAFLSGDVVITDQSHPLDITNIRGKSRTGFAATTLSGTRYWIESNNGSFDPDDVIKTDVTSYVSSGYWCVKDNILYNATLTDTEFDLRVIDLSTGTTIYTGRIFDPLNPLDIHYLPDSNSLVAVVTHVVIIDFLYIDNYFVLVCRWDIQYSNSIWHRVIGFITFQYNNGSINFTYPKTYLYDPNSDQDYYPIFKNTNFDWYRYESISLSVVENIPVVFRSAYNHAYFTYTKINDFDITKLGLYLAEAHKTVTIIPTDLCPIGKMVHIGSYIAKDVLSIYTSTYEDNDWHWHYTTITKDPYDAYIDEKYYIGFCYDGVNDTSTYYYLDGTDIKDKDDNILDTLPTDWYSQCNDFVHNDPDFFLDRQQLDLLYLTGNKYILLYSTVKGSTGYIKYSIVENDGTTLTFNDPVVYVFGSGAQDVILSGGCSRPFIGVYINSDSIYIAASPCFMLVKEHWTTYEPGSYYTGHFVAKIDPSTFTITQIRANPWIYLSGRMGVHEEYGPYIIYADWHYLRLKYIDNSAITDTNTRLTACFDDLLVNTGTVKDILIQTLATPSSHYVYIRSSYGIYFTNKVKVHEQCIDLSKITTPPATLYMYIKPASQGLVEIDVTNALNLSRPLIGTIHTSTTSVDEITVNNPVFVDNYRIYNELDGWGKDFVHTRTIVSSHHSDMGDAPQFFPTLLGTTFFTYNPPAEANPLDYAVPGYKYRVIEGVVKLEQYASTIGTATIVVPELSKIDLVIVQLCNSGDGFNHAYLDQATYINLFTENIANNQFDIKCTSGATLDFDYVWVHWIAIGEE